MAECIKRICIDTSALPKAERAYQQLFPIVKKRIEDRCGAVCLENDEMAEFVLRFVPDQTVPAEGFRLTDGEKGITVTGRDFLALMYGAGQFLHKSRYTSEGLLPTTWRGQSVPQNEKRVIQLEQHFYNWYQCASEEELREVVENLVLWGLNGVSTVFSCLNLDSWEDPKLNSLVKIFRSLLKIGKELTLKLGMEFSNVDFAIPREDLRADYKYLFSKTGNLICPSTPGGYEHIQGLLEKILSFTEDIGLDFIVYIAYDEGGCSCDKCWPWAGRGYYDMARKLSRFVKQKHPNMEFWLFTWYVGRGEDHIEEWPSLYKRLQEDAAKGDNWVDYLLLETRDDYDQVFYPVRNGQPTAHTKLLTFPDVSMTGVTPWGGFGAVCTPELMKRWEKPFEKHCNGGYLYSEGIWDDINKAIMLGLYWDRNRSTDETLADYCGYEYLGIKEEDFVELVKLIEASQSCTNRIDHKPSPREYYENAWALAEKMNAGATEKDREYWKWRIMYFRAYLDFVRYTKCAEMGWPLLKTSRGWFFFWRRFLEHDQRAQDMLLELIHLYKAQEYDDPERFAYHYYLRPPMTRGANREAEALMEQNNMI